MCTSLRVSGSIGRPQPDPSSPSDSRSVWIGMVRVHWDTGTRSAAIIRVNTGRGAGDPQWGPHVLILRWIGDPPADEVAQAVYDLIRDGGQEPRTLSLAWSQNPRPDTQYSYQAVRQ